jgi:hypothetical protein
MRRWACLLRHWDWLELPGEHKMEFMLAYPAASFKTSVAQLGASAL